MDDHAVNNRPTVKSGMLARWVLLPLLLLLLAIPAYALALMLLFLSPPLLTVFSFRKTEADGEHLTGREILIRLGIAWFVVPLALLGFIAPATRGRTPPNWTPSIPTMFRRSIR